MHVAQARDEAFGWSRFKVEKCLEKLIIVKLNISVPETDTGG